MSVIVTVDTPVLKRELLYEIIGGIQSGYGHSETKGAFFNAIKTFITEYGANSLRSDRDPPEYHSVEGGSERVLRLLNETWTAFFTEGSPASIDFEISINLTQARMVQALCYALTRRFIRPDEDDGEDIDTFDAAKTLYWALYPFIEAGENGVGELEELSIEVLQMCTAAVRRNFPFFDAVDTYGCWSSLWASKE